MKIVTEQPKEPNRPQWEQVKLDVSFISHFPMMIQEVLDDWPWRQMTRILPTLAYDATIQDIHPDDIKLKLVLDLWEDFRVNATYETQRDYPRILLEILQLQITDKDDNTVEEIQTEIDELIHLVPYIQHTTYERDLLKAHLSDRMITIASLIKEEKENSD